MDKLPNFHCDSDMKSLVSQKIDEVFNTHHLVISPECIEQLCSVVLNVFNAVEKQHNDLTSGIHIKKSCSEEITHTDIALLIQYDLYQQLERMKKPINYPVIKDIGNLIMSAIEQYAQELPIFNNVKVKI